jgi:elongation factor Ts
MAIPAADVKKLRDRTGVSFDLCKKALTETNGDMEAAVVWLREKHKGIQEKLGTREAGEGRIAVHIDPAEKVGAILEMRCETAPSAKSDLFVQLANDLARQVAIMGASTPEELLAQPFADDPSKTVSARISEVVGLIRENMRPARMARLTGSLGSYVHHSGTVGVLLEVEGDNADPQLLRDVCMHITAVKPVAALREQVSQDKVNQEMEIARAQAEEEAKLEAEKTGKMKPANILEKMAEGKLKKWFAENVLVEQPFVKDPSKTVGELLRGAGLKVVRFVRMEVGQAS